MRLWEVSGTCVPCQFQDGLHWGGEQSSGAAVVHENQRDGSLNGGEAKGAVLADHQRVEGLRVDVHPQRLLKHAYDWRFGDGTGGC